MTTKFWDQILYDHAMSYLHVPYRFGGEFPHPDHGMDCSAFVIDLLQGCGVLPNKYDNTAQGLLHDLLAMSGSRQGVYGLGTIVFWGESVNKVTHVDFMLDPKRVIGAIGGQVTTQTLASALSADARVKIRPLTYRSGTPILVRPSYASLGALS